MMLTVHMDKKWFFLQADRGKVYIPQDKLAPAEYAQHKSHITKLMFVGVIAQPWKVGGYAKIWWEPSHLPSQPLPNIVPKTVWQASG